MSYILIIVESPAKCDKIEKYLGKGYRCIASYGHLQQLSSLKDIDINNKFIPKFSPIESKKQHINKMRKFIKDSKEVILATDDDREGEGIAWHICSLFNLSFYSTKRIIFHEITETAIKSAILNPITLNLNLVNAQQGRQILDLLVGYKISPILWKNISRTKEGLSAGRCQTPALRLVYDNKIDIENSPGKKVYNTIGYFTDKNIPFNLNFCFDDENLIIEFLEETTEHVHLMTFENSKESIRKAPQPFTTSTLQQISSNELHISPKETMAICQKLYEGGYITYMRTDSKVYSNEFIEKTNKFIKDKYIGYSGEPNPLIKIWDNKEDIVEKEKKRSKKKEMEKKEESLAQEAHEAIRPTNITLENLVADEVFSQKDIKLYRLIWRNTLESCMTDAIYLIFTTKISAPKNLEYKYISEQIKFPGWKIVNGYEENNEIYSYLKSLKGGICKYKKIVCKLTIKDLKSHYTEAKLVQLLEQKGIGRPSTFSSLIEKIQERGYVKKENIKGKKIKCSDFELEDDEITEIEIEREFGNEKNKLVIQSLGIIVLEFLLKTYKNLFEYEYTKNMEDYLDLIAKGEKEYQELCLNCLTEINNIQGEESRDTKEDIKIDENHVYIIGKNGPVIKCLNKNENYDNETKFLSVKKNIDLEKLRKGEYLLEEIIEDSFHTKKLGTYEDKDLLLKKGQFGLFVEWGENKRSINNILIEEKEITIDNVVQFIEESKNINIIREINSNISIRKGKYGNYIFYKTQKMKKPKFYKLNEFKEDYKNCEIKIISDWLKLTYNLE